MVSIEMFCCITQNLADYLHSEHAERLFYLELNKFYKNEIRRITKEIVNSTVKTELMNQHHKSAKLL